MRTDLRRCSLVAVAAAAALAAPAAPTPASGTAAALCFTELSTLSGGPIDFAAPLSQGEKASGAFVDVDGDGWDDMITLGGAGYACQLFLNRPAEGGGREWVKADPGHGLDSGQPFDGDMSVIVAADVDNDGDEDLFLGGGFNTTFGFGTGRNCLMINDGTGVFSNAATALGIAGADSDTSCAAFLDIDMDGDLDLFTADCNAPGIGHMGDGKARLFRNRLVENGSLGFEDITATHLFGTEEARGAWAAIAFDADSDGDQDIVLTHDLKGPTQMLVNDGTGVFTDGTAFAGAAPNGGDSTFGNDSPNGMGIDVADYDHDGALDIYITDINDNPMYRGLPQLPGKFQNVGALTGTKAGGVTWGCNFADFDLDGHPDLYVAGGDFDDAARLTMRPWLFRNDGGGKFSEIDRFEAGLRWDTPLHREMGSAVADYDGDGDPDLLVVRAEKSGASPYFYRNDSPRPSGTRWVAIRLRGDGVRSNRSAIGARITLTPRNSGGFAMPALRQVREVHSVLSRGSRNSLWTPFGFGTGAATVDIEVRWPRAGTLGERTVLYLARPLDQVHEIVDEAPEEDSGALVPAVAATTPGARVTLVPLPAVGEVIPGSAIVESGPAWATVVADEGGWSLRAEPPCVASDAVAEVVVLAGSISGSGTGSRTTVTLDIPAPPRVEGVTIKKRGRLLVVEGKNFRKGAVAATVDGYAAKRVVHAKAPLEEDGDNPGVKVRLPKLPPASRGIPVDLVITNHALDLASDPYPVTLP